MSSCLTPLSPGCVGDVAPELALLGNLTEICGLEAAVATFVFLYLLVHTCRCGLG